MDLFRPELIAAFFTLAALEIVLGIDNIVFISILAGRLPESERARVRTLGLLGAMVTRIALLFSLSFIMGLTEPFAHLGPWQVSGRGLILVVGGLFLIAKATHEIHVKLEGEPHEGEPKASGGATVARIIVQIALLDIVFSLDSVITAVGMVDDLRVMVGAVVAAVLVMLGASGPISGIIEEHPTLKMLALSFLLLVGTTLVAEGFGVHVEKGYIYAAMAFSLFVEILNIRTRRAQEPT